MEMNNNEKKFKIALGALVVVAICGLGFGIFGMAWGIQKDSQVADLKAQVENLGGVPNVELPNEGADEFQVAKRQNPVISATAPLSYKIHFTSASLGYGEEGTYQLSLAIENGEIYSCNVNQIKSKWVGGPSDGGMVRTTSFLKDCEATGLTGKIYKVVEVGEGQDGAYDSIAFIMTNGSVEYFSLNDALEKSDFNIRGKLKINGFVVDAFTVSVGEEGAIGGYATTIFVLDDGSYVKYDTSMLN